IQYTYSVPDPHLKNSRFELTTWISIFVLFSMFQAPSASAQGTLEDYQRAQRFLPGNLRHSIYVAEVSAHWIDKTNRFWYHKENQQGSEFIVVDADRNTVAPAFDHAKLASALSHSTKRDISASDLPFDTIEFAEDQKSISFELEKSQWTCTLADYECKPIPSEGAEDAVSPDKKWNVFVKEHNLYLKNISTGTTVQLTRDGVSGCDYATPLPALRLLTDQGIEDITQPAAVFWSPDSSKFITYRVDSRDAGRFTSVQFVPPSQLRPKAYTVVYPLPGEVLPQAQPIIFDVE